MLSALAIAGCGDADEWLGPDWVITSMSLYPGSRTLEYIGQTYKFSVGFRGQPLTTFGGQSTPRSSPPSPPVTWKSSDPAVFAVDSVGNVTAVANGAGELYASADRFTDTAFVTVDQVPRLLSVVSGSDQEGPAGSTLPHPISVEVTDWGGHGVTGVVVSFAAEDGGSVSAPTAESDADGVASVEWTLGDGLGEQQVRIWFEQGPVLWLKARAVSGVPPGR